MLNQKFQTTTIRNYYKINKKSKIQKECKLMNLMFIKRANLIIIIIIYKIIFSLKKRQMFNHNNNNLI